MAAVGGTGAHAVVIAALPPIGAALIAVGLVALTYRVTTTPTQAIVHGAALAAGGTVAAVAGSMAATAAVVATVPVIGAALVVAGVIGVLAGCNTAATSRRHATPGSADPSRGFGFG